MTATLQAPAYLPAHPALTVLAWEDERTDVHGVALRTSGHNDDGHFVQYDCVCGFKTAERATDLDASAELISHALHADDSPAVPTPATIAPAATRNRRRFLTTKIQLDAILSPAYLDWVLGQRDTRPAAA